MKKINIIIVGGSGYVGGELLRLLLQHPYVNVQQVTSERFAGQFIKTIHPNLRQYPLTFSSIKELAPADVIFLCLPHGESMKYIKEMQKKAPLVIDLSGDLRLDTVEAYEKWYKLNHVAPDLLKEKTLGLPELYKNKIKTASLISCSGCMSTTSILALYPLVKTDMLETNSPIVIEAKAGSSGSGNSVSLASQHAERSGSIRSFKPTSHRHTAEIMQELEYENIAFSATGVEAVRGILITAHVFLKEDVTEKDIWLTYRNFVKDKPFLRLVKEQKGIYRYPEPKILIGTNVCEIGFEKDPNSNRLVVMAALDNLMKGAAGQAVQCLNIKKGWDETTGLSTVGLHPI